MKKYLILMVLLFTGCEEKLMLKKAYIASTDSEVQIGDKTYTRGEEITYKVIDGIIYDEFDEVIDPQNLVVNINDVVKEEVMYVKTKNMLYSDTNEILDIINKSEELEVLGYVGLNNGVVEKYKVKYKDKIGYMSSVYLSNTKEGSENRSDVYEIHEKRLDTLGGGSGKSLDFHPREKPKFENNEMPEEVKAIYVTAARVNKIDEYIKVAKDNNLNSIVIDIKDNQMPGYKSEVFKKYSKTNYDRAFLSLEDYKEGIKKVKDAGLYAIGRITVFKDSYYISDNKENAIMDKRTNEPLIHSNSKWPSAFITDVWEFNVELAVEGATVMGFNEIQFDYIRFPDRTTNLEKENLIDFNNKYNLEKAEAIQLFLMYATDILHEHNTYVSADVFGESAHSYITAYGQYFPAISNVVDVVSPMPYPDHFSKYEYNLNFPVWTKPYELLNVWGKYVVARQSEIKTPAKVRNWIQAYDTTKSPRVIYDSKKLCEQIKALYENEMNYGYMTWNSSSSIERYESYSACFKGEIE